MTILLLADHDGHTLGDATARAVSAARDMGGAIHVLVAGENVGPITQVAANVSGVDKVLVADDPALAHLLAEPVADLLVGLSADYAAVIAPATSIGKDILPRVAARRDVMQVSDITRVIAADTFERPVYAGNAIETVQSTDVLKVVTIRSSAFDAAPQGSVAAPVESVSLPARAWKARFVSEELTKSERPELTSARIVVSGGRGLGSAQAFQTVLAPLAECWHAAIGASRAAVDASYAPNDLQVGQTGKIVAPELYVAIGISGAIQHLAGMKDSKVIVAINKDPDAPIFQVADFGLVGDLFTLVPELVRALG
ncbi:electron transfer flavoprotein subunit alpha [Acetobacter tropicalis]|uniref:Electron transfer flavoprotein subunit alpha n=1 Tax=Acetobacter tropicalis TaxID=104102 RepID=A0A094YHK3_9PROT|nr:FAD-binding protein [Acetobacter tropicalis]KAA8391301.1 electron transfer flavoprotein subunit alpha [Acetobacter tropicalis]KAA8391555.1 electron transfer flavoprotein subunit alpha [Acetobacter tropicalis]KGB21525.1 Electron transfer flavoprotein, alpha subunit [Acetobacter tropicalis]MBC9007830.1 electron transfer flavoprotein subunit alpha [Acetobacter tropicalis]MDO8172473.1 FAD-binding protein [Acetobacter tropicalis]